jgi:hypothetical protein
MLKTAVLPFSARKAESAIFAFSPFLKRLPSLRNGGTSLYRTAAY